jgi:hypothetical protein
MTIAHEVNVRVLSLKRQGELNEPLCPPPDVGLAEFLEAGSLAFKSQVQLTGHNADPPRPP